jgi:hypothetical protein
MRHYNFWKEWHASNATSKKEKQRSFTLVEETPGTYSPETGSLHPVLSIYFLVYN